MIFVSDHLVYYIHLLMWNVVGLTYLELGHDFKRLGIKNMNLGENMTYLYMNQTLYEKSNEHMERTNTQSKLGLGLGINWVDFGQNWLKSQSSIKVNYWSKLPFSFLLFFCMISVTCNIWMKWTLLNSSFISMQQCLNFQIKLFPPKSSYILLELNETRMH